MCKDSFPSGLKGGGEMKRGWNEGERFTQYSMQSLLLLFFFFFLQDDTCDVKMLYAVITEIMCRTLKERRGNAFKCRSHPVTPVSRRIVNKEQSDASLAT